MAWYSTSPTNTFKTNADLSSSAYRIVKMASGYLALEAAGTAVPFGVLTDEVADGSSTVAECSVQTIGIAKCVVGAAGCTEGVFVMGNTGGTVVDATTGKYHIGVALQTGTAGETIEVQIALGQLA